MAILGSSSCQSRIFQPAYVGLWRSGELSRRVERALGKLADCTPCPRDCHVDRLADKFSVCRVARHAIVSTYFPHFGEEDCLRGWRGSGTIFFAGCNLRCVFCQNFETSWKVEGELASPSKLALMMLDLQERGCHNINFVTPEHMVPQILEALPIAVDEGLRLPLIVQLPDWFEALNTDFRYQLTVIRQFAQAIVARPILLQSLCGPYAVQKGLQWVSSGCDRCHPLRLVVVNYVLSAIRIPGNQFLS